MKALQNSQYLATNEGMKERTSAGHIYEETASSIFSVEQ
jgi:hypothetical protein